MTISCSLSAIRCSGHTAQRNSFMDGHKKVAIISDAASTGKSVEFLVQAYEVSHEELFTHS